MVDGFIAFAMEKPGAPIITLGAPLIAFYAMSGILHYGVIPPLYKRMTSQQAPGRY